MDDVASTMWKLAAVGFLVGANGFFVAVEFALVSLRQSRIEELIQQKVRAARALQRAVTDLDRYIAGAQVGITLASIALGWVGEPTIAALLERPLKLLPFSMRDATTHGISIAIAYCAITFMHVVFGEQVPKCFAIQRSETAAIWLTGPMAITMTIFGPLVWVLNGASNMVLRLMGLQPATKLHGVHSIEELQILVHQSHEAGVLDDLERQMLQHTFRFSELTAGDVMIPRPDMVALDIQMPTEQLLDKAAQSIHTRLPVYEGTIDHIIGILHHPDLFKQIRLSTGPLDVRKLLRPPLFVPRMVHLDSLLEQFRQSHSQIAIVIDEHGGTAGLVTLEDVVEEVFGELHDSLEADQPRLQPMDDGRTLVRGDVRLDELHDFSGWTLEDPEADTIAGYVMNHLGRTARVGDVIDVPEGEIRVENMARHRITQVALIPKPKKETDVGDS